MFLYRLIDTKIICQSQQFKDILPTSILTQLLKALNTEPFSIPPVKGTEGRSYTLSDDRLHEAGYDAFITGLCFISLCNRLG